MLIEVDLISLIAIIEGSVALGVLLLLSAITSLDRWTRWWNERRHRAGIAELEARIRGHVTAHSTVVPLGERDDHAEHVRAHAEALEDSKC